MAATTAVEWLLNIPRVIFGRNSSSRTQRRCKDYKPATTAMYDLLAVIRCKIQEPRGNLFYFSLAAVERTQAARKPGRRRSRKI